MGFATRATALLAAAVLLLSNPGAGAGSSPGRHPASAGAAGRRGGAHACTDPRSHRRCAKGCRAQGRRHRAHAGAARIVHAASARADHPGEGQARSQGRAEAGAEEEAGRGTGTAAPSGRAARAADRDGGARHGRHRQRHRSDVAGQRQRHPHRQVPRRRRPRRLERHRPHRRHLHPRGAAADGARRHPRGRAGQRVPAQSAVPRLRLLAGQRRAAGPRRLPERRAHQRSRSATSSTGTSCPTTPSTASPSSAPTRCSASTPSAAR